MYVCVCVYLHLCVHKERKSKRNGTRFAVLCCCPLIHETLTVTYESLPLYWQQKCSNWSGRLLQQEDVTLTFFAGYGSEELWHAGQQQAETLNHPLDFLSGVLTPTSYYALQIIQTRKRGKTLQWKTGKASDCLWSQFVFHIGMNISSEWEGDLCSLLKLMQCVLLLMQKTCHLLGELFIMLIVDIV